VWETLQNRSDHTVDIFSDLVVPEAKNNETLALNKFVPFDIRQVVRVLVAV
jgi:hypothetical protein